jgi:hypothetical protein
MWRHCLQHRMVRGDVPVELWHPGGTVRHIWEYGHIACTSRNGERRQPDHGNHSGSCNTLRLHRASGRTGSVCAHGRSAVPERVNSHMVKIATVGCTPSRIWSHRPAHGRGLLRSIPETMPEHEALVGGAYLALSG